MARWHEYRVSPAGELALAFTNTMVPLGFGLGAGLALTLAMGLPAEEGFLETFLLDLGVAPETVWDTVKAFDFLSRIGLALMFGVGIIAAFAGCFASSHADVATARGLVAATRAGHPYRVPVPHQVERVVRKDSSALEGLLIMFSLVASILLIPLFFFAASDEFTGGMVVSGIGLAAVAGMVYWWRYLRNVQRPAQHRRRLEAAAHWTTEDEEAAWQAAREADVNTLESAGIPQNSQDPMRDYKRAKKRQRHQFVRFGKRLDRFGIGGLILAPAIFYPTDLLAVPGRAANLAFPMGIRATGRSRGIYPAACNHRNGGAGSTSTGGRDIAQRWPTASGARRASRAGRTTPRTGQSERREAHPRIVGVSHRPTRICLREVHRRNIGPSHFLWTCSFDSLHHVRRRFLLRRRRDFQPFPDNRSGRYDTGICSVTWWLRAECVQSLKGNGFPERTAASLAHASRREDYLRRRQYRAGGVLRGPVADAELQEIA